MIVEYFNLFTIAINYFYKRNKKYFNAEVISSVRKEIKSDILSIYFSILIGFIISALIIIFIVRCALAFEVNVRQFEYGNLIILFTFLVVLSFFIFLFFYFYSKNTKKIEQNANVDFPKLKPQVFEPIVIHFFDGFMEGYDSKLTKTTN